MCVSICFYGYFINDGVIYSTVCYCFTTTALQKELWFLRDRSRPSWRAVMMFKVTCQNWGVCCSCACSSLALYLKHCLCQVHSFMGLCSGAVLACFSLLRGRDCTCHLAKWLLFVFISRYFN